MDKFADIDRIVSALKKVPAKSLLIIELANIIPIVNGHPDIQVLKAKQKEIQLAATEAKAYGGATLHAVSALSRVKSLNED